MIELGDLLSVVLVGLGAGVGLTAAFYSRDPAKIAEARKRIHVGNLYINRKCTGALSGTHAFGGYGMSGTNAKVGGPDYLFWFLQTKTVAQKY